jgi:hypothetical protein
MGRWLGKILARQTGGGPPPAGYFAASGGGSTASGDINHPWDLQTALNGGYPSNTVKPGDTVWLRGGTYTSNSPIDADSLWRTDVSGSNGNNVTFRSYPNEWAILDGAANAVTTCLKFHSTYVTFRDFQVCSSATDRTANDDSSNPPGINSPHTAIQNDQSFGSSGTGCKAINMIVKNCGEGINFWTNATDTEVYGNWIYYHGWNGPTKAWGIGCYAQNQAPSVKTFKDNIVWGCCEYQFQAYGESVYVENCHYDGNICFADGVLNVVGGSNLITVGGGISASAGHIYTNGACWAGSGGTGAGFTDFSRGVASLTFTGNFFGTADNNKGGVDFRNMTGSPVVGGAGSLRNKLAGWEFFPYNGWPPGTYPDYLSLYPNNDWWFLAGGTHDPPPSGQTWTLVRPNQYETGRGHVAIFNWDSNSSVNVNVSSILTNGDNYAVYHAMDPSGIPAQTGTFGGTTISFPMTGLTVETPVGRATPSGTGPKFAAFIVRKT